MPSSDGSTPYTCKQTGCVYGYRGRTDHGAKTLRVEVTIRPSWDRSVVPWLPRSHAGPFGDRHIPQRWRETCALITYDPWATRMLVPPGRPGLCLSLKGPDVTPGVTHPISVGGNFSELRKGPPRGCLNSHSAYRPVNLNGTLPLATSVMTSERMNGVLLLVCLMATTILVVSGPRKRSTLLAPTAPGIKVGHFGDSNAASARLRRQCGRRRPSRAPAPPRVPQRAYWANPRAVGALSTAL